MRGPRSVWRSDRRDAVPDRPSVDGVALTQPRAPFGRPGRLSRYHQRRRLRVGPEREDNLELKIGPDLPHFAQNLRRRVWLGPDQRHGLDQLPGRRERVRQRVVGRGGRRRSNERGRRDCGEAGQTPSLTAVDHLQSGLPVQLSALSGARPSRLDERVLPAIARRDGDGRLPVLRVGCAHPFPLSGWR